MTSDPTMTLLGARHQKRPSALKKLVSRVMARNLSCLIVPGPEVALAHGLDVTAAGMRIAATPRDAGVLLIIGELSQKMDEVVAVLYAQMPRPRATLVLGGPAPSSLPHPDVSAGLSQEELTEAVGRVQRAMAEGAFAASPRTSTRLSCMSGLSMSAPCTRKLSRTSRAAARNAAWTWWLTRPGKMRAPQRRLPDTTATIMNITMITNSNTMDPTAIQKMNILAMNTIMALRDSCP